jgi:ATP-dependent RNA helicase DeaD
MSFNQLGLRGELLSALEELNFTSPTPIQEKAIPHLLKDQSDFVGLAQTGTGKTAAFGLPLLSVIDWTKTIPQGIVICPTRELCLQITKDLQNFAKFLNPDAIVAVYGGADIRRQMTQIKQGVNVIVATPGRLVDLINRKAVKLSDIEVVVLDEADEMLNMGFKDDIDAILQQTPSFKNVWLFSATMPAEVARIAKNYMENPLEVSIGHKNQSNENISHVFYTVKEKDRYLALKRLIDLNPTIFGLIFCRTRRETQEIAEKLAKEKYSAEPLHGDLSQAQRDRVMARFRKRDLQLLIATDVAARGIDVDDITHVINYNLPDDIENYTHRSGRTARAGKKGFSLVLINPKEKFKIKAIEKQMRTTFAEGHLPTPQEVCEIQLNTLIEKVIETQVKEEQIAGFMPAIYDKFKAYTKEDIIDKFVSTEFNRFLEFYQNAKDLNYSGADHDYGDEGSARKGRDRDRGNSRNADGPTQRYFVSLGRKDGLNPGGLLRVICDASGLKSRDIGKIDILNTFSFFETKPELASSLMKNIKDAEYEGKRLSVELTKEKAPRSEGRGRGGNFKPDRKFGNKSGKDFKGKSNKKRNSRY